MPKKQKQEYGDIIQNHDLVKRTLMVSAFPAMIKSQIEKGKSLFCGLLPGFEFAQVDKIEDEDECVQTLQDMLDDEVEELIVFGKSLPMLPDDDGLLKQYPGYKIVYLDINVYVDPSEEQCEHDCSCCSHDCNHDDCDDEDCDCHDDCDCGDDDCDCGDEDCDCGCHDDKCDRDNKQCSCGCDDKDNNKKVKEKTSKKIVKCDCPPTCTCGCQDGKPCTCNDESHKKNNKK